MNDVGVEAMHQFFVDWQQLHRLVQLPEIQFERWQQFFSEWKSLETTISVQEKFIKFDCGHFEEFVKAFAEPYDNYCQSGAFINIWQVAGIGKDELRNSAVLAWMLDHSADHGQGSSILERLVAMIGNIREIDLSLESIRKNNYRVKTESLPMGELHSRIDIEVEGADFLIFIEVKINAQETNDQLQRYLDLVKRKSAGRSWAIIFLTPTGRFSNKWHSL